MSCWLPPTACAGRKSSGAREETLLNQKDGGVSDVEALRRDFWRPTPEARREALMPFVWRVIGVQGQIYGNRDKGSPAKVANGMNFLIPATTSS